MAMVAFSATAFASTNPYRINDDAVEAAFAQSTEQVMAQDAATMMETSVSTTIARVEDPDGTTAGILALLLGAYGVHRVYLNSPFKVAIIYWVTCGGVFGIFPLIDAVKLFTSDDISPYIGNESFKMW